MNGQTVLGLFSDKQKVSILYNQTVLGHSDMGIITDFIELLSFQAILCVLLFMW